MFCHCGYRVSPPPTPLQKQCRLNNAKKNRGHFYQHTMHIPVHVTCLPCLHTLYFSPLQATRQLLTHWLSHLSRRKERGDQDFVHNHCDTLHLTHTKKTQQEFFLEAPSKILFFLLDLCQESRSKKKQHQDFFLLLLLLLLLLPASISKPPFFPPPGRT